MKKTISKHLFLLLAILLAGTGQAFAYTEPVLRGDANSDTNVNIADIIAVANRIYNSSFTLNDINADANGDNDINIADVITIANIIYLGTLNATGTISGWTEGNDNPDELLPMQGDSEEDDSYGD